MTRDGTKYSKRDIAIINFPYTNLKHSKKRPVLILAEKGNDFLVCAITSKPKVKGVTPAFEKGSLPLKSTIKYWQIQTIVKNRVRQTLATITVSCYEETVRKINKLFTT